MTLKKWQLISSQDISPSPWFPLEKRTYKLPNDSIVDDFYVTPIADVSLVIPITPDNQIIMINQYKPGVDSIMTQFPGGRYETHHQDMVSCAIAELKEEAGIIAEPRQLQYLGKYAGFPTKGTEVVHFYFAQNCTVSSDQHLDKTEAIQIVKLSPEEINNRISSNQIWCAHTVAGYTLAKAKFPELFK